MISLQYKGRIHKSKFSLRSLRYILSDRAARAIPGLQRRWLLPVESLPIAEAAGADLAIPSIMIDAPLPEPLTKLGISHPRPLHSVQHFYSLADTVVTGWAGAMIKDGLFLAVRPRPNWVAALRAHPHRLRRLSASRPYYNLMAPIPARGHIFHWLFDSIVPLMTYMENGGRELDMGLIVNAEPSEFQRGTIDFLRTRYGLTALEPLAKRDAVHVPHLMKAISVPHIPGSLQSPIGLAMLDDLGRFLAGDAAGDGFPRRIYISRNDARLRRVRNEDRVLSILEARGFKRLVLKGLPIARQVRHFRRAEAVVAPHGAGLAHTAWCKPGTKVIEFFPGLGGPRGKTRNATADMWLIAMQRGLDYRTFLAGPPETRDDGFAIPEDLLRHALEASAIE